ncbi:MAG: hypothetical protein ABI056_01380 [Caulobacteraceae bacterium]
MWKPAEALPLRRIQIAPLGRGWTVGEASLDNAQFFNSAAHAEAAARNLGQRLTDAGQPSEVHLRLSGGRPGGHFICVAST